MEGVVATVGYCDLFGGVYNGRRVFITGHTGFKGAWLTWWLLQMGAQVTGYALEPPTSPSLFEELALADKIDHTIADVRDLTSLSDAMQAARPEIVFHLAAQPLVRLSYAQPVDTFATNVMGTVNVLEAARNTPDLRVLVVVTSDKCYDNREWEFAYRENDAMGGHDPYSSSKGCAELVTSAYRDSFFGSKSTLALASARAGNVIGGGDWAQDRIIPDCIRALTTNESIQVRNPDAVRPWQHVMEPLSGYLLLASRMFVGAHCDSAWNFGPQPQGNLTVREIVDFVVKAWGSGSWNSPIVNDGPHEARFLKLDCSKAADVLAWHPVLEVHEALEMVTRWYRGYMEGESAEAITAADLAEYVERAQHAGASWAI